MYIVINPLRMCRTYIHDQYFVNVRRAISTATSTESFFKKNVFSFYLQKTVEKWGQNFQKNSNTCHLLKKKKNTSCLTG